MNPILGIDFGAARIGIAISDELQLLAHPLETISGGKNAVARITEIVREKKIAKVVAGVPRNMDGSYGPAALKVQEFVAVLKDAIVTPIKTWDERLTSAQANRFLIEADVRRSERKEKVDKTAAAILLQSYLDSIGTS